MHSIEILIENFTYPSHHSMTSMSASPSLADTMVYHHPVCLLKSWAVASHRDVCLLPESRLYTGDLASGAENGWRC